MDLGLTYFFKINSVKMKKKKFQSMESKYRSRHFIELYVLLNPFKNSELKFFFLCVEKREQLKGSLVGWFACF